jgi:hypothetical protein
MAATANLAEAVASLMPIAAARAGTLSAHQMEARVVSGRASSIRSMIPARLARAQIAQSEGPRRIEQRILSPCRVAGVNPNHRGYCASYWKGYLKLALVSCPIALHAARSTAERIAFRYVP